MPLSLYDATIPAYLQILEAGQGLIDKAQAFCAERDVTEEALLAEHFGADMLPLSWQFKWMTTISIGAIEGARNGIFLPDLTPPACSFNELRDEMSASIATLRTFRIEDIESLVGRDVIFQVEGKSLRMDFTVENFLLSFSLPNFYFHATTAYDILRHKGVSVGKMDFLGRLRVKTFG